MSTARIAGFCLVFSAVLCAADFKTEVTSDHAFRRLQKVHTFAFGGVGFAGVTSEGELDFRRLLKQRPEKALSDFERLYSTGTPEAKAYALAGIRKLSNDKFRQLLAAAKTSVETVRTMQGCVGSNETLGVVAKQIDEDKFPVH